MKIGYDSSWGDISIDQLCHTKSLKRWREERMYNLWSQQKPDNIGFKSDMYSECLLNVFFV